MEFALVHEGTVVGAGVCDDDRRSLEFASMRGFREHARVFESVLDLASFDIRKVEPRDPGLQFASMS